MKISFSLMERDALFRRGNVAVALAKSVLSPDEAAFHAEHGRGCVKTMARTVVLWDAVGEVWFRFVLNNLLGRPIYA